jgi:hypothetical protein
VAAALQPQRQAGQELRVLQALRVVVVLLVMPLLLVHSQGGKPLRKRVQEKQPWLRQASS